MHIFLFCILCSGFWFCIYSFPFKIGKLRHKGSSDCQEESEERVRHEAPVSKRPRLVTPRTTWATLHGGLGVVQGPRGTDSHHLPSGVWKTQSPLSVVQRDGDRHSHRSASWAHPLPVLDTHPLSAAHGGLN